VLGKAPVIDSLAVSACRACGEENPERARFCLACGTVLEEALHEERKVVSVLFVDLVGFTDRSDRADPEDVRATLRPYHARVKREIERFEGTVEKFVGDAVMAVFGAPVAREDDAERAVRAALGILEAIPELNEAEPGFGLAVRVAVNTGEAVVSVTARPGAGEGIATGDVVNTAARLQHEAPVGGVVVGEVTYWATRDVVDYEELASVSVRGKAEPIRIWRASGVRSGFGIDLEQPTRAPFVGRLDELGLLKQMYARAVHEPGIQLVTVTGEPGIGKTRLLAEFRDFVNEQPEPVAWQHGRCLPYGEGITFWALGEIVKAQAGILESDSPEQASEKLSAAVATVVDDSSEREWFKARLGPLVGAQPVDTPGTAERAESFTAWRRFLESLAARRPLVLVFEDLHWADDALLEFIEHLVDLSTEVPLLLLCAARPELYERRQGWGGGKRNSTTLSLSALTGDETARLISALLSQAVLPAETQAVLLERSGGNPLYAEEFVRMLTDRGILTRRGRVVEIAPEAEIAVPETVQALIAARLDTLPADRKALLHDAAVFGKVFWTGALAWMGRTPERAVEEGLYELVRKELVRPVRMSSVKDQPEYSFWHLLVRDVAHAQIPRAARAAKHRRAAQWIERIAEERVTDHAEILAHHYGQALELVRAAGSAAEARELEPPTRRFLVMAGDRAFGLDVAKAEAYYRRALDLLPAGEPDRATVLAKAAEAAWLTGQFAEAEQRYEDAIGELRAEGNALGVGEAMVSLSMVHGFRGETARARTLLTEVIELLEREPPGPELARAYTQMARENMLSGNSKECLEWSERALTLTEKLGMHEVAVMALQFHGIARCELGDLDGLRDLREALRTSLGLGLGQETVRAHINLGDFVWLIEGPAKGLEVHRSGIEFGERRGIVAPVLWTKGETLWMLYDGGDWDELLRVADELISWDRLHGGTYFGVMALTYKAQVLLRRGRVAEAASMSEQFLARARKIEDPQILAPAQVVAALIEHMKGNASGAISLIEEFDTVTPLTSMHRPSSIHEAVRLCAAVGALDLAERLVEGMQSALVRHRHGFATARATLAEAQGRVEQAVELYGQAAQGWAEYGFVLERALALLGAGRCGLALGQVDAKGALAAARELFAQLDAGPLGAETDELLTEAVATRS
jgi:class 3 adenylate cyclase/tetratricopeptide (TPR) repeat protein